MKCYNILFKFINIIFILFFALTSVSATPVSVEQDQVQLKNNRKQALELMNTNKNAQAMDILERTGKLQQHIYSVHKDSVSGILKADFIKAQRLRLADIDDKKKEIADLKSGNEDIDRENFKMIRNTLFFFGTLVGLAVLLLLNRFRKLSRLKSQLIASESQLSALEKFIATGNHYQQEETNLSSNWKEFMNDMTAASPLFLKISNDKQHSQYKPVLELQSSMQAANSVLTIKENPDLQEKLPVDLNSMIEEVINQAYYYIRFEHPDFNCTIIKDLEKILPKVELVTADIRFVMFNLLINAFDAVREKRTNAPKGYEAKVTVSTRKLPRFVQIRVRDNGIGIIEKNSDQVFEPFYTTKKTPKHIGLGLTESKRIITVNYKGELFIESDFTSGTDFIIRFPILTIM